MLYTTLFTVIVVWFVPRFYLFFLSNHQQRVFREAIGYEDLNNYHIHENMTGTRNSTSQGLSVMGTRINVPHNHVCLDVITESTRLPFCNLSNHTQTQVLHSISPIFSIRVVKCRQRWANTSSCTPGGRTWLAFRQVQRSSNMDRSTFWVSGWSERYLTYSRNNGKCSCVCIR